MKRALDAMVTAVFVMALAMWFAVLLLLLIPLLPFVLWTDHRQRQVRRNLELYRQQLVDEETAATQRAVERLIRSVGGRP